MPRLAVFVLTLTVASTGAASAADTTKFARQLGDVVGSEAACALKFDSDAIHAFIDKNVAADDLDFTSRLNADIDLAKFRTRKMEGAQKDAHCFQVKRNAEALGLMAK